MVDLFRMHMGHVYEVHELMQDRWIMNYDFWTVNSEHWTLQKMHCIKALKPALFIFHFFDAMMNDAKWINDKWITARRLVIVRKCYHHICWVGQPIDPAHMLLWPRRLLATWIWTAFKVLLIFTCDQPCQCQRSSALQRTWAWVQYHVLAGRLVELVLVDSSFWLQHSQIRRTCMHLFHAGRCW